MNRAWPRAVSRSAAASFEGDASGPHVFANLARALSDAGDDLPGILDALTASVTASLCDRCCIELGASVPGRCMVTPRHALIPLAGTRVVHGTVMVARHDDRPSFEPRDLDDIETCIRYAVLAAEGVIRLEAQRDALRREHERAEQFHRTILAVVGHDMRGPVAAILLGTEMLVAKHHHDRALAGVVASIVSFAHRMTGMVDQVLDLSRVQLGGGLPLARVEVKLAPLLQSVIDDLARRYPRNRFSLSGAAERRGAWDPDRLRQVTATLVTNAVQHGAKDGPIRIAMWQDEERTSFSVHNEVVDEAIAAGALPSLFDPFQRSAGEERGSRFGLGLYLVRMIVEAHGGRVAVDSALTGTTFRVVLANGVAG